LQALPFHAFPLLHAEPCADSRVRQGAYGILVEVERHPFALDTMLFMDWRDDYAASDPQMQAANRCAPRGAPPSSPPPSLSALCPRWR
jgi:hypothetical protein